MWHVPEQRGSPFEHLKKRPRVFFLEQEGDVGMNEFSLKPAHTVAELASACQHQEKQEGGGWLVFSSAGPNLYAFPANNKDGTTAMSGMRGTALAQPTKRKTIAVLTKLFMGEAADFARSR